MRQTGKGGSQTRPYGIHVVCGSYKAIKHELALADPDAHFTGFAVGPEAVGNGLDGGRGL